MLIYIISVLKSLDPPFRKKCLNLFQYLNNSLYNIIKTFIVTIWKFTRKIKWILWKKIFPEPREMSLVTAFQMMMQKKRSSC